MSIQFRSRIVGDQPTINMVENSSVGWCCGHGGSYTKPQCIALGGRFLPNETNDTNCLAAGGCSENNLTYEVAGACCHWTKENELYTQKCTSVNSTLECANLHKGGSEGLKYSFYPGETCLYEGGKIICNGVEETIEDLINDCNVNSTDNCYDLNNKLGTCCLVNKDGTPECSLSSRKSCAGYWSPPQYGKIQSCEKYRCKGVHFSYPERADAPVVYEHLIKSSTDIIDKLPNPGDPYQGGIYVGIFRPGIGINATGSIVYGNPNVGPNAGNYSARGTGPGARNEYKSWILVAANTDYDYASYYTNETRLGNALPTSYYDGYYNTNQQDLQCVTVLNDIQDIKLNGFDDWYIPSQDELAFFFKTFSRGFTFNQYFTPLKTGQYMSSTVYTLSSGIFENGNFIVTQINSQIPTEYGKVTITNKYNPVNIRLFRKINILTDTSVNTNPSYKIDQQPATCVDCITAARERHDKMMEALWAEWENFLLEWYTGKTKDGRCSDYNVGPDVPRNSPYAPPAGGTGNTDPNEYVPYCGGFLGLWDLAMDHVIRDVGDQALIILIMNYFYGYPLSAGAAGSTAVTLGGSVVGVYNVLHQGYATQFEIFHFFNIPMDIQFGVNAPKVPIEGVPGYTWTEGGYRNCKQFADDMVRRGIMDFDFPTQRYVIRESQMAKYEQELAKRIASGAFGNMDELEALKKALNTRKTLGGKIRLPDGKWKKISGAEAIHRELWLFRDGLYKNGKPVKMWTNKSLWYRMTSIIRGIGKFIINLTKFLSDYFAGEIVALVLAILGVYINYMRTMLEIYDQRRNNIFGNPDCCDQQTGKCKDKKPGPVVDTPYGGGIQMIPCLPGECLGRMGQVLKEYREAIRACCTTVCVGNIDDEGKPIPPPPICGNLPLDPEQNCNKRWHGPVPPSEILNGPRKKPYPGLYDVDNNPIYHGPERKGSKLPPWVDENTVPPITTGTTGPANESD